MHPLYFRQKILFATQILAINFSIFLENVSYSSGVLQILLPAQNVSILLSLYPAELAT